MTREQATEKLKKDKSPGRTGRGRRKGKRHEIISGFAGEIPDRGSGGFGGPGDASLVQLFR